MKMILPIILGAIFISILVYAMYVSSRDWLEIKEKFDEQVKLHNKDYIYFQGRIEELEKTLSAYPLAVEDLKNKIDQLEDKVKTAETIAHSAKMDAIRAKDQKITVNVPPIKIIMARPKVKKNPETKPATLSVDKKIIKDIKTKLNEVNQ